MDWMLSTVMLSAGSEGLEISEMMVYLNTCDSQFLAIVFRDRLGNDSEVIGPSATSSPQN